MIIIEPNTTLSELSDLKEVITEYEEVGQRLSEKKIITVADILEFCKSFSKIKSNEINSLFKNKPVIDTRKATDKPFKIDEKTILKNYMKQLKEAGNKDITIRKKVYELHKFFQHKE